MEYKYYKINIDRVDVVLSKDGNKHNLCEPLEEQYNGLQHLLLCHVSLTILRYQETSFNNE